MKSFDKIIIENEICGYLWLRYLRTSAILFQISTCLVMDVNLVLPKFLRVWLKIPVELDKMLQYIYFWFKCAIFVKVLVQDILISRGFVFTPLSRIDVCCIAYCSRYCLQMLDFSSCKDYHASGVGYGDGLIRLLATLCWKNRTALQNFINAVLV